jgi:YegS/Rv2252/BmrU family lipid kinase
MQTSIQQKIKAFVVFNPVAGQRDPQAVHDAIESRLMEQGVDYEIYETTGQENIRDVVEQALQRGAQLVMACGGDGTVSAAASAMVGKEAHFAVIPGGTWNTLARNLAIPLDLAAAVDLALGEHDIRTIDVLEVDGNYYILNVSVGTGAMIMRTIEREEIRKLGKLTFFWKGLLQVFGYPPHRFQISYDGKTTSVRANELIMANCAAVGIRSMRLYPNIHLDDGKFDICRLRADTVLDILALGLSMLRGEQRKDPRIACWEVANQVRIHSHERLPVQADGEMIGELPVEVRLRPKALHIVIPSKPAI